MTQQIASSILTNKSRLRVLNARQEVLNDVFDDARSQLTGLQKNTDKYKELLKNLILEV
jgi:V-type H+-transporting ATPase subunit E